jgi:hypothetical protein
MKKYSKGNVQILEVNNYEEKDVLILLQMLEQELNPQSK